MNLNIKYIRATTKLFGLWLVTILYSCVQVPNFPVGKKIVCNAEVLNSKGNKFKSQSDSLYLFGGGNLRTNKVSHLGEYSAITIPNKTAFAFTIPIKNVGPDWFFRVSVWRKSNDGKGALVVDINDAGMLYLASTEHVEVLDNGWEKLQLEFFTPPNCLNEKMKVYVWNNGADTVYFDDLKIERLLKPSYPEYIDEPLAIIFDTSQFIKILDKRKKAFEATVLQTSDDDWVKGIVVGDSNLMKAKIRLKGDWLDHLRGDKWSFRIKMRKNYVWNNLRTFSVQTPESRAFLFEWVAHKLFASKDILTTRYGFVPLTVNNQSKGLYAWEEHFVKQLLESRNRREGPIIKFSEDAFWQNIKYVKYSKSKKWSIFPFYEAAVIKPFGENRTSNNPVLFDQFCQAQKLLYQYKKGIRPVSEIFDIKKLATYYAMLDLLQARHGMVWINQRFYYNPVIGKLEPIAYDCYSKRPEISTSINDNFAFTTVSEASLKKEDFIFYHLFTDRTFVSYYLEELEEVSNLEFINNILVEISKDQLYYDSLLSLEFPLDRYDNHMIRKSAKAIRDYLPALKSLLESKTQADLLAINVNEGIYVDTAVFENTPEFFVNAYTESSNNNNIQISIHNYFPRNLILLGTSRTGKRITNYFFQEPIIKLYNSGLEGTRYDMEVDSSAKFLYFMVEGRFDTFKIPIYKWPYPKGETTQQELFQLVNLIDNPIIDKISDDNIYIKNEELIIDQPIIIPSGYRVHFKAGTVIDFIDSAAFISYSSVHMNGTPGSPIIIKSSDFSANGFTILQASESSIVDNVKFQQLNTLDYKGWTLTGAVTFYESDVDIKNAKFYRNQCEDALNIIRSDFTIQNTTFDYTYADAFDADFCDGKIINCVYRDIGNDAMDFSGSKILIKDTKVLGAEDKGISGGENSRVKVINTDIKRANIGLASKDMSVVDVENSTINLCNYGIVLLQKKPEFGPSTMKLVNTKLDNLKYPFLIELNSTAIVDNDTIKGIEKNLGERFY
ncbi:MAG: right-handed parallel beta-helix repeat-containing protein [Bacteroidales bacterium]|nr:right-handed parallel beta-helix repeat-containing protein [Bacteroidales bacterium]